MRMTTAPLVSPRKVIQLPSGDADAYRASFELGTTTRSDPRAVAMQSCCPSHRCRMRPSGSQLGLDAGPNSHWPPGFGASRSITAIVGSSRGGVVEDEAERLKASSVPSAEKEGVPRPASLDTT